MRIPAKKLLPLVKLIVSKEDDFDIQNSVQIIKQKISNLIMHQFSGKGHFTFESMKTEKFPELLNIILQ